MRKSLSVIVKKIAKFAFMLSFALLGVVASVSAQNVSEGETLFKQKCTACHAIDQQVVGPALKGLETRRSEAWIIKWVKDSQAMVKAGDKDAVKLFEQYKVPMTAFPDLTDDNIKNIVAYIKDAANKPVVAPVVATVAPVAQNTDSTSTILLYGLGLVAIILLVVILVLQKVIAQLNQYLAQETGEKVVKQSGVCLETFKNKKKLALLVLVFAIVFGGWALDYLWNVGVHTGYQPEQPIKYSHELHAGTNKIDCRYCHSGAYKSKNATIPSANVCMNCHKYVQAKDKYNGEISPEIKKIYEALDYNPETQTYGANQKPIKWVRIHNLPDFAYFNHSQHVKVGGVKCQKCHGPIETMKEVYQYSPLTMKWCVNCHKETDVKVKGNAYYDKLTTYHDRLKKGEKVSVATIGGLECGKCHY